MPENPENPAKTAAESIWLLMFLSFTLSLFMIVLWSRASQALTVRMRCLTTGHCKTPPGSSAAGCFGMAGLGLLNQAKALNPITAYISQSDATGTSKVLSVELLALPVGPERRLASIVAPRLGCGPVKLVHVAWPCMERIQQHKSRIQNRPEHLRVPAEQDPPSTCSNIL